MFDIKLGVRQEDVLSPLVFSIFFNGLIKALKAKESHGSVYAVYGMLMTLH